MPGKVNPVIPEAVNQIVFEIIGNDAAVTSAAQAGQLQLNAMEPLIAYKLFSSIRLLVRGMDMLRELCIEDITANETRCRSLTERSIGLVTILNPVIGYENATRIAQRALAENCSVLDIARAENLVDDSLLAETLDIENMVEMKTNRVG